MNNTFSKGDSMNNIALITGVTGQDGSYLAEFLLDKGYEVHGLIRRHSTQNTERIDHILAGPYNNVKFFLHYADTTDSSGLIRLVSEIKPTEVYNLAAQSHVGISFEVPEYTAEATGVSTLKLLEAVRMFVVPADIIRHRPQSSSAVFLRQLHRVRRHRSIPRVHTEQQSFIHTGSP